MSERASYDYRTLGKLLRRSLESDGRGWAACARQIGVTASDLSRISNGREVSAAKVIAVCDWLQVSFRAFYTPGGPGSTAPSGRETREMFHGKSTETERTAATVAANGGRCG